MHERFVLFGPAHLLAIAAIALTAAGLVLLTRRVPASALPVRIALSTGLLMLAIATLASERRAGADWAELAPLHLCDAAIAVAIWALWTQRQLACELIYFWGAAGTVLAVVTPDLAVAFPAARFLTYFALHGGVILAAVWIPFGLRRTPRPGAVRRAMLWTNLYAALVGAVNFAFGTNFLYLRAKPSSPTPLDWFGPWPIYLLACELIALGLFSLLYLPFRGRPVRERTASDPP